MVHVPDPAEPERQALIDALVDDVAPIVAQHAHLQVFCNPHTYVRYLRARGWNFKKASEMLKATLQWRIETKPHEITWYTIAKEAETGKQMVFEHTDKHGHPIVLMRPRCENTKEPDTQVKFLIYHLELASKMTDASGVGKMVWLLDFEGFSMWNSPPMKTSRACLNVLQDHYPERLGCAVCYHAPMLFSTFFKAISPFIDPVTKQKIAFIDGKKGEALMHERFDMSKIESCMGGEVEGLIFNLDSYSKRMMQHDREVKEIIHKVGGSGGVGITASSPATA